MKKIIHLLLLVSVIASTFALHSMEPPRKKRRLETDVIPSILGKPKIPFLKAKLIHDLVNHPECLPILDAKHLSKLSRKDHADIIRGVICNYDCNIKPQKHLNEIIRFLVIKWKFCINEYESICNFSPLCIAVITYIEQPNTDISTVKTLLDLGANPFLRACKKKNISTIKAILCHKNSNIEKGNTIKVKRCDWLLNLIKKK